MIWVRWMFGLESRTSAQADGFIVEGDQRLDTDWSLRDWLNNSFPHSQHIDSVIIYTKNDV